MNEKLVVNKNGESLTYNVITTLFIERYNKNYVVYSEDFSSNPEKDVMLNSYIGNLDNCTLLEIKDDEEWLEVTEAINNIIDKK